MRDLRRQQPKLPVRLKANLLSQNKRLRTPTTPRTKMKYKQKVLTHSLSLLTATAALIGAGGPLQAQDKKANIVMLMTDDTGWDDFGCYSGGGAGLGHPTPNVDKIAKEGAVFTSWYGQASCTAGRASFLTGRIPIRSALSIVVAPATRTHLRKETPTIAEFFKKNGYTTYFSGKWHMGDKPEAYPIEHGFDEMKTFCRLLCRRLFLQRHQQMVSSLVPVVQSGIRNDVRQRREPGRVGRRGRPARQGCRDNQL